MVAGTALTRQKTWADGRTKESSQCWQTSEMDHTELRNRSLREIWSGKGGGGGGGSTM